MKNKFYNISRHLFAILIAGTTVIIIMIVIMLIGNVVMSKSISRKDIVTIPDLVGLYIPEANERLKNVSLFLKASDYEYNELEIGKIISQIPSKDRLIYSNRTIEVVVSRGPKIVLVPTLTGISFNMIEDYLRLLELRLGTVLQRYSNDLPAGFVIESEPKGGTSIMAGKEINIIVSIGRDPIEFFEPIIEEYDFWEDDLY